MDVKIETTGITLILGDITEQETDAMVNVANPTLMGAVEWRNTQERRSGNIERMYVHQADIIS
jgi:hypothetical protein